MLQAYNFSSLLGVFLFFVPHNDPLETLYAPNFLSSPSLRVNAIVPVRTLDLTVVYLALPLLAQLSSPQIVCLSPPNMSVSCAHCCLHFLGFLSSTIITACLWACLTLEDTFPKSSRAYTVVHPAAKGIFLAHKLYLWHTAS